MYSKGILIYFYIDSADSFITASVLEKQIIKNKNYEL